MRDRAVLGLIVSIFLFHLANAPILPATALYVKKLGGSDSLMTATVLTAQLVMVPVSLFAGHYGDRWGRKAVMAIAFWFLPLRIFTYTLVASPKAVVWLQGLDGIAAGIYGVIVIALAADLTRGRGSIQCPRWHFCDSSCLWRCHWPADQWRALAEVRIQIHLLCLC